MRIQIPLPRTVLHTGVPQQPITLNPLQATKELLGLCPQGIYLFGNKVFIYENILEEKESYVKELIYLIMVHCKPAVCQIP